MAKRKPNIGDIYPDPPRFQLAAGSHAQYKGGVDSLVDTYKNRSLGNDIFDYIKYLFEPQRTQLNQDYGINTDAGDVYSTKTGILPQTLASLNSRGLLDTGTSGLIEGQLRSNLANKTAELFGNAKQLQRQDIDNALEALSALYPQQFEVNNIPNSVNYFNEMNQYNVASQRNAAQQAYEASQGPKTLFGQLAGVFGGAAGTGIGYAVGGPIGGSIGGSIGSGIGNLFSGKSAGSNYKASDGGYNFSNLYNMFSRGGSKTSPSSRVGNNTPGLGSYYKDDPLSKYYNSVDTSNYGIY